MGGGRIFWVARRRRRTAEGKPEARAGWLGTVPGLIRLKSHSKTGESGFSRWKDLNPTRCLRCKCLEVNRFWMKNRFFAVFGGMAG
jgi:hypothetical protein